LRERSRYTILDLLDEMGLFEHALDVVFSGDGIWAGMEP
jgi:hypothetical protein